MMELTFLSSKNTIFISFTWSIQVVKSFLLKLKYKKLCDKLVKTKRFFKNRYKYRVGKDLSPPPQQPQLQPPQKIYTYSIKISSLSDPGAKFHEPEFIFNA